MGGKQIPYTHDTRYLGVQLDLKLNWSLHFGNVAKRAKQYLMQIMSSINKKWGPKPKLVRWIYIAIVRPRLIYAAMVWSHNINQQSKLNRLKQIN